jgi:hypothetical protein
VGDGVVRGVVEIIFIYLFILDATPSFLSLWNGSLCASTKKRKKNLSRIRHSPIWLFLTPSIPALLVGRGVTTQVPSSNNSTNKKKSRTQSQKKSIAFNIK